MKVGSPAHAARAELHRLQRHIFSLTAHRERWADADERLATLAAAMPVHVELQEIVQEMQLLLATARQCIHADDTVDAAALDIERLLDDVGLLRPKARACWHGFAAGMQDDHEWAAWWFTYAAGLADYYTPMLSYSRTVLPTAAFDAVPPQFALPPEIIFGPPPPAAELLFVVSCDPVYSARYAAQYVTAIRRSFQQRAAVHIHLLGTTDPTEVEQLGVTWSLDPTASPDLRSWSAIGRYVIAPFVMERSAARWCVVTDVDMTCCLAPGGELPELPSYAALRMSGYGLMRGLPWKRVIANFAAFPNTVEMRGALRRLSWAMRAFFRADQLNWGIDQNVLFAWQRRQIQDGMTFVAAQKQPLMRMMRSVKIRPAAAENAAVQSGT